MEHAALPDMETETSQRQPQQPLIFGEVLFDCFEPEGNRVLGGAPFNVAWHLQGFGLSPLFISAIGRDDQGDEIMARMQDWGMDTRGIQQRTRYPTGMVRIQMDGSQHSFEILPDQAYDHIEGEPVRALLENSAPTLLYFGSLATRNRESAATLNEIISTGLPAFVDINLRSPWWQAEQVNALMKQARWLKVNDEELTLLRGVEATEEAARAMREELANDWLILTRGGEGASIITEQGCISGVPPQVRNMQDTVGAGDAFSSVVILGLISGWETPLILERALEFAARICEQRGATRNDPALYNEIKTRWKL